MWLAVIAPDAAAHFQTGQGEWENFSLDMLLTFAARAGLKPSLRLAA